jgi:hypothetical protein
VGIGPSLVAGRPTPGAEVVERGSGESRRIQRPADVSFPDGRGQRGPSPLARPESDAGGCCRCCRSVFSYPSPARRCRRSGDLESCWRTWIPSFLPRQHYVRTPAPPATSLPPLSLNLAVFAPPPRIGGGSQLSRPMREGMRIGAGSRSDLRESFFSLLSSLSHLQHGFEDHCWRRS